MTARSCVVNILLVCVFAFATLAAGLALGGLAITCELMHRHALVMVVTTTANALAAATLAALHCVDVKKI